MTRVIIYLTFNGNCREAMSFYRECLGGELSFQTVEDTPGSQDLPPGIRRYVIHASLTKESICLVGTDMAEDAIWRGNALSILLECDNDTELRKYFERLSSGGKITHPLDQTYWGTLFGGITDRYGYHWLFRCPLNTLSD